MNETLPPLDAVISRRNGAYLVEVSGVEIATCDDFVGATNRLCTEAAKYRRRVFVTVAAKHGQHHLEIDENGTIARTTAPATGAASLPENPARPATGRPAGSPGHSTPVPDAVLVGARTAQPAPASGIAAPAAAAGGVPARAVVTGHGAGSLTWRAGSHRATLVTAAVLVALVVVAVAVSAANFAAANRDRASARGWADVQPVSVAELGELREQLSGPADTEAALRASATRFGLDVTDVESAAAPATWDTTLGEVPDTGRRWQFTVTGPRVADYLAAWPGQLDGMEVEAVTRDQDSATLSVRTVAVTPTAP